MKKKENNKIIKNPHCGTFLSFTSNPIFHSACCLLFNRLVLSIVVPNLTLYTPLEHSSCCGQAIESQEYQKCTKWYLRSNHQTYWITSLIFFICVWLSILISKQTRAMTTMTKHTIVSIWNFDYYCIFVC